MGVVVVTGGGQGIAVRADVTVEDDVDLFDVASRRLGPRYGRARCTWRSTPAAAATAGRPATSRIPMARGGEPHQTAAAIISLLGDEASYVTGAHLDVGGGR